MAAPDDQTPTAFVIMPFGPEFDKMYEHFIRNTIEGTGLAVTRADNSPNSQAITKDIVLSIRTSDLIVADLSDANANVYYELGIAHTFNKPVILLSQSIDDVKFDLKAYRCLLYTEHFHDMDRARLELAERVEAFKAGTLQFSNPVSDAVGEAVTYHAFAVPTEDNGVSSSNGDDDLGSVDYAIELEDSTEELAASIERFGTKSREFTSEMNEYSKDLQAKVAEQQEISNRERRRLFRAFAERMDDYARFLATENDEYSSALDRMETALDGVVNDEDALANPENEDVLRLASVLKDTETAVAEFEQAIGGAADSAEQMPRVEKSLNRARSETVRQLHTLAENANRTVSVIARARRTIEARMPAQ